MPNEIQELREKLATCGACCQIATRDRDTYKDALRRVITALRPKSALRAMLLEEFPELKEDTE